MGAPVATAIMPPPPRKVRIRCGLVNLASGQIRIIEQPCGTLDEALGGFGRAFLRLLQRPPLSTAYHPDNPLIVNTGLLTASNVMTGLRTFFCGYSPLKVSKAGQPGAMWSAGSGNFGSKFRWSGLDELVIEERASQPTCLVIRQQNGLPQLELRPADFLRGLGTHEKIMRLHQEYPKAHFAVIGPAGENFETNYMGAVALSTDIQLKTAENKPRWAGRGGMGSLMGYKNLLAIVAQADDNFSPLQPSLRDLNREIARGPGSAKFREVKTGGMGGTWSNYVPLHQIFGIPERNFRPSGTDNVMRISRPQVEPHWHIQAESCLRCGIHCHKQLYYQTDTGKGEYLAKFDFEPVNLLGSNLGLENAAEIGRLIHLVDELGMDSISLGTTLGYVLDYNERHPQARLFNGARFGDAKAIRELVEQVGRGQLKEVGQGLARLTQKTDEAHYAMQVKGLELPAYLPETNPGYAWAIAGGHMSMATFMLLAFNRETSLAGWVTAITERGLLQVRDDLIGICKFAGINHQQAALAVSCGGELEVSEAMLTDAVRRCYLLGLWMEQRQGYQHSEYTLPEIVFSEPNPHLGFENFLSREFFAQLSEQVWAVFDPQIETLVPAWQAAASNNATSS